MTRLLDIETLLAGLDSPNHSEASRRAWVSLFFRDMQRAATGPEGRQKALTWLIDHSVPMHSTACAGQDDEDPCICGVSAEYDAVLALGTPGVTDMPDTRTAAEPLSTEEDAIRSFVANVETMAEDNGTPAVLLEDLRALARDWIRDHPARQEAADTSGLRKALDAKPPEWLDEYRGGEGWLEAMAHIRAALGTPR